MPLGWNILERTSAEERIGAWQGGVGASAAESEVLCTVAEAVSSLHVWRGNVTAERTKILSVRYDECTLRVECDFFC